MAPPRGPVPPHSAPDGVVRPQRHTTAERAADGRTATRNAADLFALADRPAPPVLPGQTAIDDPQDVVPAPGEPAALFDHDDLPAVTR